MPHILVFVLVLQLARRSGASYGNCSCFESQDNITFDNGTSIAYVLVVLFRFLPIPPSSFYCSSSTNTLRTCRLRLIRAT